ncbi:alkaline phosphatase [Thalassotalea sp. PLHSN55]|uniref:alkaline phosphatase n=1 Tax=Thalassotalea sp. PLHSN55 TaxID=3435888 RepID=UPI003F830538
MKKSVFTLCLAMALSACGSTEQPTINTVAEQNTETSPKNIIMIVADGMGPAYTTAYRYYRDNPETDTVEATIFDRYLVGMSSTYPDKVSGVVTDSAASATALASGVKTYNGAIGLDVNKQPVETVLEWAKKQGKKTGVVVTSQVNHATPASYLSHNESRQNYNAIADSYLDDGIKADVILGGGWQYFIRDDRNLVAEFKQQGFHYVDNYDALTELPNKPLLGLFADKGLPWALDDTNPNRLSVLTQSATQLLENPQGYFMLVEASQIDWGGHVNDVAAAMTEMDDLAATLEYLSSYVEQNPDTLVVLTADHSTGGFTIGANGKYAWQPEVLHKLTMSPQTIAKQLLEIDITLKEANKLLSFELTKKELMSLQQAKYEANEALQRYFSLSLAEQKLKKEPKATKYMHKAVTQLIDVRTNTGWTSSGHTGIDVPVFAFGPKSELFNGKLDNTDIAKTIFRLLGKNH